MQHYGRPPSVTTFMCVHTHVCIHIGVHLGYTQACTHVSVHVSVLGCAYVCRKVGRIRKMSRGQEATCRVTGPLGVSPFSL